MWNDDEDPWAGSEAMASMEAEWLAEAHDGPPPEEDTVEAPEEEAAKEVPEASSSPSTPSEAGDSSLMEDLPGRRAMSHSPARPVMDATRKRASPLRTLPLASDNKETPPAKRLRGKQPPRGTPEKKNASLQRADMGWFGRNHVRCTGRQGALHEVLEQVAFLETTEAQGCHGPRRSCRSRRTRSFRREESESEQQGA